MRLALRRWWAVRKAKMGFRGDTRVDLLRRALTRTYVVTLTLKDGRSVVLADVTSLRVDPCS